MYNGKTAKIIIFSMLVVLCFSVATIIISVSDNNGTDNILNSDIRSEFEQICLASIDNAFRDVIQLKKDNNYLEAGVILQELSSFIRVLNNNDALVSNCYSICITPSMIDDMAGWNFYMAGESALYERYLTLRKVSDSGNEEARANRK